MIHRNVPKPPSLAATWMIAGYLTAITSLPTLAQPVPAPLAGDLPCAEWTESRANDTLVTSREQEVEGFLPLFDGTFKGWFQNCGTMHSQSNGKGAIFRIAEVDGRPALYTTQRDSTVGGVMMTNRVFGDYEVRFQMWPDWGNDAGFFNRSNLNGRCYRTTLGYLAGSSIGGAWGESGFSARDLRPFSFGTEPGTIYTPGGSGGGYSNWTAITANLKASSEPELPCPASGCTEAEWHDLWDREGWIDFRIKFYGGASLGSAVHMKSWFKKPSSPAWVPILQDTTLMQTVPDGHLGFMVHGGGRYSGKRGTWYRDIRWRPLERDGAPYQYPVSIADRAQESLAGHLSANAAALVGSLDRDYAITVRDGKGRMLERFSGKSGSFRHAFSTGVRGVLLLSVETPGGSGSFKVVRP